jgi:cob(I)alamin adenosyltransferase
MMFRSFRDAEHVPAGEMEIGIALKPMARDLLLRGGVKGEGLRAKEPHAILRRRVKTQDRAERQPVDHAMALVTVRPEGEGVDVRPPDGLAFVTHPPVLFAPARERKEYRMTRAADDRTSEDVAAARHRAKMAKRKEVQDREVASKTREKGLLIVHTGPGKGKSTAAFGLVLRALGRGFRVGVVQFIKGAWETGERAALDRFGTQIEWHTMGEGFTWETQDRARDVAAAERAFDKAQELMDRPDIQLLVLDELNIALRYDYLPLDVVVARLRDRRPDLHIVVTGRNAKPELIEAADLVTEMSLVKHHFAAGVKAQVGIEF